jgi:hypothetical protein
MQTTKMPRTVLNGGLYNCSNLGHKMVMSQAVPRPVMLASPLLALLLAL